jgi:cytochrome oxidase Cu insertion factor (SCO1/SenC/PrrC family)
MTMIRTAVLLIPILVCTMMPTLAQSPRDTRSRRGSSQVPQPGTNLPTVRAVDEQGRDFSTASLRGSYTVLVFGCLT